MKAVLRGGPLDGKVVEVGKNTTMVGEQAHHYRDGMLYRIDEVSYYPDGYERHPCKKRGVTKVFRYAATSAAGPRQTPAPP